MTLFDPIRSRVASAAAGLYPDDSGSAAAATLLELLAHGERVAMRGAAAQARIAPDTRAGRFLRAQTRHEAFHARVFETAGRLLAPADMPAVAMPPELAELERRTVGACGRRDFAAALLIQQVFLEGLGDIVLRRLDRHMAESGDWLPTLRGLILRQEAAHHRFGLDMLDRCIEHEPGLRTRLAPLGRELFDITTVLLAWLDDSLHHAESDFEGCARRLHGSLPPWLGERMP